MILVNSAHKVSKEISLVWNKKNFKCWVIEEESKWIPDFLKSFSFGIFSNNDNFLSPCSEFPIYSDDGSGSRSGKSTPFKEIKQVIVNGEFQITDEAQSVSRELK